MTRLLSLLLVTSVLLLGGAAGNPHREGQVSGEGGSRSSFELITGPIREPVRTSRVRIGNRGWNIATYDDAYLQTRNEIDWSWA